MSQSRLFSSFHLRSVGFPNRIGMSPMCQYSCREGFISDWHLVHLGSRAVGGAGLILFEATAVSPEGRISPLDLGIWNDSHIEGLARCVRFIHGHGSVAGIQLAHAGRKACTPPPWQKGASVAEADGGWRPIFAPSAISFSTDSVVPKALEKGEIQQILSSFFEAAKRAYEAGFRVIEIHAAHGYLLHQFLSPLTNHRQDEYGGTFENRTRLLREVIQEVRKAWPEELPLFVRISATDWVEGGWNLEQTVELSKQLKTLGIDLMDVSSGGLLPNVKIPVAAGYQVPFAECVRRNALIPTAAVGLIKEPLQAEEIIEKGEADMVLLGRQLLREPYWPQRAAKELKAPVPHPIQYDRAIP